jgi:hypothetical protein
MPCYEHMLSPASSDSPPPPCDLTPTPPCPLPAALQPWWPATPSITSAGQRRPAPSTLTPPARARPPRPPLSAPPAPRALPLTAPRPPPVRRSALPRPRPHPCPRQELRLLLDVSFWAGEGRGGGAGAADEAGGAESRCSSTWQCDRGAGATRLLSHTSPSLPPGSWRALQSASSLPSPPSFPTLCSCACRVLRTQRPDARCLPQGHLQQPGPPSHHRVQLHALQPGNHHAGAPGRDRGCLQP